MPGCPGDCGSHGDHAGVVFLADQADLAYSQVTTRIGLILIDLIDLTNASQRRIGVDDNALVSGQKSTYPKTRA